MVYSGGWSCSTAGSSTPRREEPLMIPGARPPSELRTVSSTLEPVFHSVSETEKLLNREHFFRERGEKNGASE